jgi:hypothetical protein
VPTAFDSVDAATVTARLRCFVAALAPACASRVGLRIDSLLYAEAARCVTRAAPPCVRFDVWNVECTAADAPLLREALRPGAVLGCTLTLTGLWPAADVQTAMDALRASAVAADAAAGEQLRVSLRTAQVAQAAQAEQTAQAAPWSADACAPLAMFLRAHGAAVASLDIHASADALALLLPLLPAGLEQLDLSRCDGACAGVHDAIVRLLRRAVPAGLRELALPPFDSAARACAVRSALAAATAALPRRKQVLTVTYAARRGNGGVTREEVDTHVTMLALSAHARQCACVAVRSGQHPEHMLLDIALRFFAVWRQRARVRSQSATAEPDVGVVRRVLAVSVAALHAAAADAAAGAPRVRLDATSLARIVLAMDDAEDVFHTVAAASSPAGGAGGGVAALLRSLATLLPHDAGGFVAALLHALLRSERAAALPAHVLRDVAAGCGVALQRQPVRCNGHGYALLSWLLACTLAGITPARDADMPPLALLRCLRRRDGAAPEAHTHLHAVMRAPLRALLHGAVRGHVATHAAHLRQQSDRYHAACALHDVSWRAPDVVAYVDAVCTLAPDALLAPDIRAALLALCAECARRFNDERAGMHDPTHASCAARRAGEAYAACVDAALLMPPRRQHPTRTMAQSARAMMKTLAPHSRRPRKRRTAAGAPRRCPPGCTPRALAPTRRRSRSAMALRWTR